MNDISFLHNQTKVSVVIPLFNKEKYICRAIESVLGQTQLPDEIVVVDDGSMDRSADEVWKIEDSRVRLIQQANAGEGAARNKGVAEAKYELVAFLDADDEWRPDFLSHIHRLVNNFPDCGAYATAYEVIRPGMEKEYPSLPEIPPAPWIGILPNMFKMLQQTLPFFPSSIAMPRKVFHALGGFPTGVKRGADLMMWIQLGLKYPIAYSPSPQAVYHTEADNRACNIFPSLGEPASARLIAQLMERHEIPAALVEDVMDYYAIEQIGKAGELVKAGHSRTARDLLSKVRQNRKYRRIWLWWSFWAILPPSMISLILSTRTGAMAPGGQRNPG
jgi:hypothetical protein